MYELWTVQKVKGGVRTTMLEKAETRKALRRLAEATGPGRYLICDAKGKKWPLTVLACGRAEERPALRVRYSPEWQRAMFACAN